MDVHHHLSAASLEILLLGSHTCVKCCAIVPHWQRRNFTEGLTRLDVVIKKDVFGWIREERPRDCIQEQSSTRSPGSKKGSAGAGKGEV